MMLVYLFLFLIGLCVGSFLNVVIYRETRKRSTTPLRRTKLGFAGQAKDQRAKTKRRVLPEWLWGRSYCDHCKKAIAWHDNIPLLSFALLGGRCRFCRKKISFQYPVIEFLAGIEFIWFYWLLSRFSFFGKMEGFYSLALLFYWFFIFSVSVVIFVVDWQKKIIPDSVLWPAVIVCLGRLFFTHQWSFFLWALVPTAFFAFLYFVTRGKGMGFGDVKLSFLIGLVLGWPQRILIAFFLAFLTGGLLGGILVLLGKKRLKDQIPFGPFLIASMWIAKLWGDQIAEWYFSLLR